MSSTRFNRPQYVGASVTNVYQPSAIDRGHTMQPPPLPAREGNYYCSSSGFSDVTTYLTKPIQRKSSGLRHQEVIVSESMSLTQFVERYSKELPLQIKVLRGYCGNTSRLTISADDTYNIHFVKRVKVVHIVDIHNQRYSVPINSCVEFGVAYDSKNESKHSDNSLSDHKLARVSDVVQLSPLPKVICALTTWKGDDDKSSVVENELLVVKQVHKSKFKNKRSLKVYSVSQMMEKVLPEECYGNFSTQPYHNRILLADLFEHSPEPFPCAAVIYLNAEMYSNRHTSSYVHDIPEELLSRMVTMVDVVVETSLVSSAVLLEDTCHLDGFTEEDKGKYVDIPLEGGLLQIEVALVDIQQTEKLYDDTRSIYEKYNPCRVTSVRDVASNRVYSAQSFFYSAVRSDCETLGVEIEEPSSIYEPLRPRQLDASPMKDVDTQEGSISSVNQCSRPRNHEDVYRAPPLPAKRQRSKKHVCNGHQKLPQSSQNLEVFTYSMNSTDSFKDPLAMSPTIGYEDTQCHGITPHKMDDSAIGSSETDSSYDDIPVTQALIGSGSAEISTHSSVSPYNMDSYLSKFDACLCSCDRRLGFIESQLKTSKGSQVAALKELEQLKGVVDQLFTKVKFIDEQLDVLQGSRVAPVKMATSEMSSLPSASSNVEPPGESSSLDANKQYLSTMTVANVINLLKAMDLTQYTEGFLREQISGEILTELDDEILKTELGVTSKLHRIRLMKVARGQQSAFSLLSGLRTYT